MPVVGSILKTTMRGLEKNVVSPMLKEAEQLLGPKIGLFSKLEQEVSRLNFTKMPAEQLRKTMTGRQVSPAETESVLGGLEGTVNREQVRDAIAMKGMKLEDVVLGEVPIREPSRIAELQSIQRLRPFTDVEAREQHDLLRERMLLSKKLPKYEKWQEPGAVPGSYREMFVTAPDINIDPRFKQLEEGLRNIDNMMLPGPDRIKSQEALRERLGFTKEELSNYFLNKDSISWQDGHSAYSDIQNPIVRIRYNDREVNGKKILFVEEMQGPAGDTKWRVDKNYERTDAIAAEVAQLNQTAFPDRAKLPENQAKLDSLLDEFDRLMDEAEKAESKVFDNKKSADEWAAKIGGNVIKFVEGEQGKMPPALQSRIYDIGVKRVLALAKEKGYDGVAWTTGEMQASRYDLSKHITRLEADVAPDVNNLKLWLTLKDGSIKVVNTYKDQLSNTVGKELAAKILNGEGKKLSSGTQVFTDLDLKVGGEGLKSLYDKILPSMFKKYGKEEVRSIELPYMTTKSGEEITGMEKIPYIPITSKTPSRYPIYSAGPVGAIMKMLQEEKEKGNAQSTYHR
jgi:hypothetical protein